MNILQVRFACGKEKGGPAALMKAFVQENESENQTPRAASREKPKCKTHHTRKANLQELVLAKKLLSASNDETDKMDL